MDGKTEQQLRQELAELWSLLRAEREGHAALRKDAERYRKLIASGNFCVGTFGGWALRCGGSLDTKAELDAAADALPAVGDA